MDLLKNRQTHFSSYREYTHTVSAVPFSSVAIILFIWYDFQKKKKKKKMTGKNFRGKDHCYVCGNELHWCCPADTAGDAVKSPTDTDIPADMTAIGKDDNGAVRFEVVCTCPKCHARNKFFIGAKII